MSLRVAVTERVTQDLLGRVITQLSSASHVLSSTQIDEIAATQVESYRGLSFAANNDIGLCVERLIDSAELAGIIDGATFTTQYPHLLEGDELVTTTISTLAHGIARMYSQPLYELRVTVPEEAKKLAATITNSIPADITAGVTAMPRRFTWGRLASGQERTAAMLLAQDRLRCFQSGEATRLDTDRILRALPRGDTKTVAGGVSLQSTLSAALEKAALEITSDPTGGYHLLAAQIVTDTLAFRRWIGSMRAVLETTPPTSAVVTVTDRIDAVETVLHAVDAATLTAAGVELPAMAIGIMGNVELALENIRLLRAAMIHNKEHLLKDRLLLSFDVVQDAVLEAFMADGGTEAMIIDYLNYVQLNPNVGIPANGVALETLRTMHPKIEPQLHAKVAELKARAASRKALALQNAVTHALETYSARLMTLNSPNIKQHPDVHRQLQHQAISQTPRRPLEDIAVEYLVGLRASKKIQPLHAALSAEFTALMQRETEVTPIAVAQATCTAVARDLLTRLGKIPTSLAA